MANNTCTVTPERKKEGKQNRYKMLLPSDLIRKNNQKLPMQNNINKAITINHQFRKTKLDNSKKSDFLYLFFGRTYMIEMLLKTNLYF